MSSYYKFARTMATGALSVLLVELTLNILFHPQVNIARYLRNAVGGYELPQTMDPDSAIVTVTETNSTET